MRHVSTLLLIDTCGGRASIALAREANTIAEQQLPERSASAGLINALQDLLTASKTPWREVQGVGVVNGPGSFTGLRVGLAVAKGLCEAHDLPLAAVSRLEVLAEAGHLVGGLATLSAGRHQAYLRDIDTGHEWLSATDSLAQLADGRAVVYTDAELEPYLRSASRSILVPLTAVSSLLSVRRCFAKGGTDPALADANYVRNEEEIYARQRDTALL